MIPLIGIVFKHQTVLSNTQSR